MSQEGNQTARSSGGGVAAAIIAFLKALLRLLVVVLVLLGVAALIYWGIPQLYQAFIVPVEENTIDIRVLETRQDYAEELFDQQFGELSRRLDDLESDAGDRRTQIGDLESGLQRAQTDLEDQQSRLDDQQMKLDELTSIQTMLDTQDSALEELSSQYADLEATLRRQGMALERLLVTPDTPEVDPLEWFEQQLVLLRVMDQLTQARLSLLEGRVMEAIEYTAAARGQLMGLRTGIADSQAGRLSEMIFQLDMVLLSLPEQPDLASERLQTSWTTVSEGLPAPERQVQQTESKDTIEDSQVESEESTPTSTGVTPTGTEVETTETPTPTPVGDAVEVTPTPVPTES